MTKVSDLLHQKWVRDKHYKKAHDDLAPEFDSHERSLKHAQRPG